MHPLFNQQMVRQHMDDLQHEAELAHLTAHLHQPRSMYIRLLGYLYDRTRLLYRRPVVRYKPQHVKLEEIKPALVSTFSLMHEVGLVSEYDDQFLEQFVQTLERELAHQCR